MKVKISTPLNGSQINFELSPEDEIEVNQLRELLPKLSRRRVAWASFMYNVPTVILVTQEPGSSD